MLSEVIIIVADFSIIVTITVTISNEHEAAGLELVIILIICKERIYCANFTPPQRHQTLRRVSLQAMQFTVLVPCK